MSSVAITIWIVTLVIVILIIVPLTVSLLSRSLKAARNIEEYLKGMLEAGVKIIDHTNAVRALDDTLSAASAMHPVAKAIDKKTGIVAGVLAKRAEDIHD